ncbi:hypothetical protein GCM10010140_58030 [Streptosporangium pseudovulgare]|uniref:DUF397 domain-containing protein n=1 Tax=Streptosporangium pseudovulgare TaxID=35765 RepID=A0ABQ2R917_9ACTN|nr:hypothetical protein GCM10010140_58030 [Streptosporangium pseudovulgare]
MHPDDDVVLGGVRVRLFRQGKPGQTGGALSNGDGSHDGSSLTAEMSNRTNVKAFSSRTCPDTMQRADPFSKVLPHGPLRSRDHVAGKELDGMMSGLVACS